MAGSRELFVSRRVCRAYAESGEMEKAPNRNDALKALEARVPDCFAINRSARCSEGSRCPRQPIDQPALVTSAASR